VKNTGSNKQIRAAVRAIVSGVSAAAASAPLFAQSAPATGQSAQPDQLQEVVITGIKASLQKSLDIKENAIGIIDAISAEDIGAFPDATIGQAISRIPGVTVDRGSINLQTSAGAATSTGNVTGVTIRGFGSQFNEILSDGRLIASALGQQFDFSALSSDWIKEVQVLKTPDATLSTGALGGTILVKFPNPLDTPGLQLRGNLSATDYQNDGGVRPSFGALVSNTFADDKFGILLSGDYHDTHVTNHHVDVVGWKGTYLPCSSFATNPNSVFGSSGCASVGTGAPGTSAVPSWYPQDMAMYLERADERRIDGRVSLQWRPNDALLITIDDNYSSSDDHQDRFQFSTWFGAFPNATQDANGTITNFAYTGPTDFNAFVADNYITTNTPGINMRWDMSSKWTAVLDAAQSTSKLNPNHDLSDIDADTGYGNTTNNYTGGLVTSQSSNTLPYWSAYGPNSNYLTNPASPNFFGNNPFIIGSHVTPLQMQINTDKVTQAKLEFNWLDESSKSKLNVGFQYIDNKFDSSEYDDFSFNGSNNNWQLWSGYGPASGNNGQGVALPPSLFAPVNLPNFIPGMNGSNKLPPGVNIYNPYAVLAYLETQPINPGFVQTNGYPTPTYPNQTGLPPIDLCPSCVNNIERKNYAPFLTAEHTFDIAMPLIADLGLRYQHTQVTSAGLFAVPVSAAVPVGDKTAYSFNFGPTTLNSVSSSYGYFLPSLDLNLMVRPDFKVRFDVSRTSSEPPNLDLKPNTSYGGRVNALVANSGNPALLPYLSNNFDLGAEWYYARNSYLAADLFFKHITQFPINGVTNITLPIKDPNPLSHNFGNDMVFADTTIVNGQSANVDGVELTWQQLLPYGFGYQINGTYVHTNKPFDPYNIEQNTTQFALPGIGNSANLIAFYQKYGFQARLAVQWQGRQFLTFGQEQNSAQFGTEPTFIEAATEVDFSTSYDINSHLAVFFEALNLTDSEYHTTGRFDNQLLNVVDYGRSFTLQVRAKL
jgi:iron complex outermembrane recepter protein